ncbi:fungal mating-type domain-containing protein-containing protein [Coprinopsis cinerea okayama7|uniref:Fungal mating-type domain-containing protein-containing protein n=1 Tax=Coprinopsis cinerea (strain Okayama-7 / 130 / ATCC MYA-4618 / FGSC 9003) TaxID=240176 RepID=D6RM50_COPC7|nr:fungal mating-type domain-containing protein-containing protein [Coprinopsis cinerea okayama7\|eukprot:XP_002911511.1 fungal mating-type domain-containing protein-containing protein [Coprinopsis cinerea okayama7\
MAGGLGEGLGIKGRRNGPPTHPTNQPTNQPPKAAMDSFTTLFSNNVSATTSVPVEEETGGGRGTGAYCTIA